MTKEPTSWRDMRRDNPEYIDPGPRPPGYPEPVAPPDRLRRGAGLPPAPGTAYTAACTFFLRHVKDDAARLAHGTIAPAGEERREHAWVELPDGLAWDGVTRLFYPAETWHASLGTVVRERYTRVEVARLLLHTGHAGPWDDGDRAAALDRG